MPCPYGCTLVTTDAASPFGFTGGAGCGSLVAPNSGLESPLSAI